MIDVAAILYDVFQDERVYDKSFDLIDSGLLDSLAFIELFSVLEEVGIVLSPTRIDRQLLRTPGGIEQLLAGVAQSEV